MEELFKLAFLHILPLQVMFTPTIPHRVLFPPDGETYEEDRCVVIASLHASDGAPHPLAT